MFNLNKEQVLVNWFDIFKYIPVNWKDKISIQNFKSASERYSKSWDKLPYDQQGWVSEQIRINITR